MLPVTRDPALPARTRTPDALAELDRLTRDLTSWASSWPWMDADGVGVRAPFADLEETDDAFVVEVDLPGVAKGDVGVAMDGRRLEVHATRHERERVGILRHRTRHVGTYHHEVVLPLDVDVDGVEADLHDGVLTVRLPKQVPDRRRHIAVR